MTYSRGIRIYGELRNGSFGQVTRGICQAAQRTELFKGLLRYDLEGDQQVPGGADALVSVSAGGPNHLVLTHTSGVHKRRWILVAPNSEGFPSRSLEAIVGPAPLGDGTLVDGILVPSMWALRVLAASDEIPDGFPAYCAPHGVGDEYRVCTICAEALQGGFEEGAFRVAHITSSEMQRKGTLELLRAWRLLRDGPWKNDKGTQLAVVTHPTHLAQHRGMADACGGQSEGITVMPGLAFTRKEMVNALSYAQVVCQTSRAEGFGLVPLEASCCGVPVVVTNCTGHTEYVPELTSKVVVPHGELAEIDDYPGAVAPSVNPVDIADALLQARDSWASLQREAIDSAPELAERWSWKNKTGPVLETLVRDAEREEP
jgi:hypothetical protein